MSLPSPLTPDAIAELDRRDPLALFRQRFILPSGLRYFDGNSLGPLQHVARDRAQQVVSKEWGNDLISSWNTNGWIELPRRVGARIARLIGASAEEVVVADSTSVNLFKLLAAALDARPERSVILSEPSQFPTDLYMAQGLAALRQPKPTLRLAERHELHQALDEDVAVVSLSHVDFKSGEVADLAALTRAAHDRGVLVLWDLSHSAGAMEIDLAEADVDLAVGCTYKFMNGGPGAPAYVYVAHRLHQTVRSPLWGWFGHRSPFAFATAYQPAEGIDRFQCGTPPILSLATLDAALEIFDEVELSQLRRKSMQLGDLFLDLVEQRCAGHGLHIVCPVDASLRGSHVALRHPQGYAIIQALIDRGIVGDFRSPDILRFGLGPLYLRFGDVWDAVAELHDILESRSWEDSRFHERSAVT